MKDSFTQDFGDIFAVNDIGERIYQSGWNAALDEAVKQIQAMPFGGDTIASFVVYLKDMKEPIP